MFDLDRDRAEELASQHDLPRVYRSQDELLADGDVEVVDMAVVPWAQLDIVRAALAAGKHLMCKDVRGRSSSSTDRAARAARASTSVSPIDAA